MTASYLEDLLRPLQDGGKVYQLKILTYFAFLLDKTWNEDEVDNHIDTWPESWEPEEITKMDKVKRFRSSILKQVEELWEYAADDEVKDGIMAVVYSGHPVKQDLLSTVRSKLSGGGLSELATDKIARILYSFLKSFQHEELKPQAANLLLFNVSGERNHLMALRYLREYLEKSSLNQAEQTSLATALLQFADSAAGSEEQVMAWFLVFLLDPCKLEEGEQHKQVLGALRTVIEQEVVADYSRVRMIAALERFTTDVKSTEKMKKAAAYLLFRLQNPNEKPTWDKIEKK